jgi:hypothetical protein
MQDRAPGARAVPLWFVPAGFLIGFAGALCGIGGGIFAGPLLHAAGLPLRRAAATALLVVLATTLTSSVVEYLRPVSGLVPEVAWPLAVGALLGAELGFRIAQRADERALKAFFAGLLALGGVRVLCFSQALGGGVAASASTTALIALAIGLAGGALTPLGIAGGVFMVPALFLSLGTIDFVHARACALAAGAVGAVRSLTLHARAGNVTYALGWPLALGSLLGAVGGVQAAHDPDLAHWGRILLGCVLLAQALRFALDLRRPRAPASDGA